MRHYEITFIVDPLLPSDEVKGAADLYINQLKAEGCEIVHVEETGVRQLAYIINKRSTGVYYTVEISAPNGDFISKMELAFRRDDRVLRFLTISLDKYGVQYNQDKRAGVFVKRKQERLAAEIVAAAAAEDAKALLLAEEEEA